AAEDRARRRQRSGADVLHEPGLPRRHGRLPQQAQARLERPLVFLRRLAMQPLLRHAAGVLLIACSTLVLAQAQRAPSAFEPELGQPGQDVVWVPTPQEVVDRMLALARLTAKDFLIDLGSGDGRTAITAAQRGAHA